MEILFIALTDTAFNFFPAPAEPDIEGVVREWVKKEVAGDDEVWDSDKKPVEEDRVVNLIMAYQSDKTMYLVEESHLGTGVFTTHYCDARNAVLRQNGWTLSGCPT